MREEDNCCKTQSLHVERENAFQSESQSPDNPNPNPGGKKIQILFL
jgi:hypothetical protein